MFAPSSRCPASTGSSCATTSRWWIWRTRRRASAGGTLSQPHRMTVFRDAPRRAPRPGGGPPALAHEQGPGHGARPRPADRGRPVAGGGSAGRADRGPTGSSGTGSLGVRGSRTPRSVPTRRSPPRTARSSTPTSRAWTQRLRAAVLDARVAPRHEPWLAWVPLGIMLVNHALFSMFRGCCGTARPAHARRVRDGPVRLGRDRASGSNAWALHGSRTASGRPLLAATRTG